MSYAQFNGTITQYKNLHQWINNQFGKPKLCDTCGTTTAKRYDWAAINGAYTKSRKDWTRLCRSCHQKLDVEFFVGKRFSGKQHSEESKSRASEAMKKFWAENPDHWKGKMRNQWTGKK